MLNIKHTEFEIIEANKNLLCRTKSEPSTLKQICSLTTANLAFLQGAFLASITPSFSTESLATLDSGSEGRDVPVQLRLPHVPYGSDFGDWLCFARIFFLYLNRCLSQTRLKHHELHMSRRQVVTELQTNWLQGWDNCN